MAERSKHQPPAPLSLDNMPTCIEFVRSQGGGGNNSLVGFAGENYAFIAINVPENVFKECALHRVAGRLVMASSGCPCNVASMAALLRARLYMNEYLRQRKIKSRCVALMLQCLLTNSPQMSNAGSYLVAGIDEQGKGVVYAYDLLGYHEKTQYRAMGGAKHFLQSYIRNYIALKNSSASCDSLESGDIESKIDFESALGMVIKAFQDAARNSDVPISNKLVISGITKHGVCLEEICLF